MKYQNSNSHNSNGTGTLRNENAMQKLIRENADFLIEQLEAGQSDALPAYLYADVRILLRGYCVCSMTFGRPQFKWTLKGGEPVLYPLFETDKLLSARA